ncbi:MaoC family dehydratase [Rhizobiaceae bacterium BDR2-2]|uniref:MaoC family dehydratase n=1 Tax=Ectorhizobium quercum TaxID=2965071 RepID=A0AAE3MX29_9HYPH|nr:MaoC family dehydratase [Ectorhizobium quercum]MCX8996583.1 MaoC family dehydratase [Ectorhizobium quercum]
MENAILAFEDFTEGRVFPLGPRRMTREEIVAFAGEFDPQPMHTDEEAGRASLLGGLAASGWHTNAAAMRMMFDSYVGRSTSQGSPGIDELRWKRPVLAGDTLSGRSTVLTSRPLKSRPGLGVVRFLNEIENQRGELVCRSEFSIIFAMRDADTGAARCG